MPAGLFITIKLSLFSIIKLPYIFFFSLNNLQNDRCDIYLECTIGENISKLYVLPNQVTNH